MKFLSGNSKQQIIANGNPYLRVYCILAGSVEGLDVQMLFDPFEETFHLPTFPIKFSNGQVRMCEVISQEPIDISRGITRTEVKTRKGSEDKEVVKQKTGDKLPLSRLARESTNLTDALKYLVMRNEWIKIWKSANRSLDMAGMDPK